MKFQWTWLLGILFAIIIAIFSVMNVDAVPLIMCLVPPNGRSYLLYYALHYSVRQ